MFVGQETFPSPGSPAQHTRAAPAAQAGSPGGARLTLEKKPQLCCPTGPVSAAEEAGRGGGRASPFSRPSDSLGWRAHCRLARAGDF